MSYTEISEQGWFSRITGSIFGVLVGFLLLLVSVGLLWWNEGRAVHTAQDLAEGRAITVSIPSDKVDPAYEGKLVHMQGMAKTEDVLTDPVLGISQTAIRLKRTVEMYQWKETSETDEEKKLGGGSRTVTRYDYEREWSEELENSSDFKEPGHDNPTSFPGNLSSWGESAKSVMMGGHELTPAIVEAIDAWEAVPTKEADLEKIGNEELKARIKLFPGGFYIGEGSHNSPKIGDTRIMFSVVKPTEISLISQQFGKTFKPYMTRNQNELQEVAVGKKSMDEMFSAAETVNTVVLWILRFVGWLCMFIALIFVFGPLSVIADFIPFVGGIVGFGAWIASFVLASVVSMVIVASAWFAYRPFLSGSLLLGACFLVFLFRGKKKPA